MARIHLILPCLLLSLSCLCAQEQIVIASSHLQANDTVLVFTPQGYAQGESRPTLFLLHGWSGDWNNWNQRVPIQKFSDTFGFIIICPDGFYNSWYMNSSEPGGMQWRDFFHQELYPMMQARYHFRPELCFISGLSMGGQGALNIYIDDPSRFRAAGSMSGVMDLRETSLREGQVAKVLGPYSVDNPRFYTESVIHRIELLTPTQGRETPPQDQVVKQLQILISCGYDDIYAKHSQALADKCRALKIPHILLLSPGGHSWPYWEWALERHLQEFQKL